MMSTAGWNQDDEQEFKEAIERFFEGKINSAIKESLEPLRAGDDLANLLMGSDEDVVRLVTPRAVRKWASQETLSKWERILEDPRMVLELRMIGKSIANTMRPLAGNNFALWVTRILNQHFHAYDIPLKALTSGRIKKELSTKLVIQEKGQEGTRDYRPDIDIILVRTDNNDKPVAIISAKTTLAERVMQTINWSRYLKNIPEDYRRLKLYLVTAWDTFEGGANRDRVQELDGVFVCNKNVREYGNIKSFSKIGEELEKLLG
jgi:hypothetical protein